MRFIFYLKFTLIFLFGYGAVNAQVVTEINDHRILLHTGARTPEPNLDGLTAPAMWQEFDKVGRAYFGLIQFYAMPDQKLMSELRANGIDLKEYQPHLSYYASVEDPQALFRFGTAIRGFYSLSPEDKSSLRVWERPFPAENVRDGKVKLRVYWQGVNGRDRISAKLQDRDGVTGLVNMKEAWMEVWLHEKDIAWLAEQDELKFVELYPAEGKPDDVWGRSLHRVNRMQNPLTNLGVFDGDGVEVIVRDDGIVGPHIDFKGRLNQQFAFNDDPRRSHGDGVAGILGGAGNLDQDNAGMATGATIHILNYRQDLNDSVEYLQENYGAVIVSTSYSDGCNRGYTGNARTIDRQTWENPSLLHVFSAGNSNNNNCGYGAGNQWGNVTGGHKMGKNAIATANVFYEGTIVGSSSRGPAHDGRLKPEITAHGQGQISTFQDNVYDGFGGTSAAAPGISGISACLNQAYREFNGGEVPDAGLIKASILNTANDLGNPGPDFIFGFGLVNGARALALLENNQYSAVTVSQGDIQSIDLELEKPARRVRVMLYWTDAPGTLFTSRALVNDLDLNMEAEDGTIYYPLILDPTPDPLLLNAPAAPGVDHLNNVEQVVLLDPQPGNYKINIGGFEVPNGDVKAWVVYDIEYDTIDISYPYGGEAFEPGGLESIRWDAPADTFDYTLAYSLDGGANWNNIATVGRSLRTYDWEVPMTRTGQAIVRITRGDGLTSVSKPFSIYPRPQNVEVIAACPEGITVRFDEVPDATSYVGYILGDNFMEEVASSDTNIITIPVTSPEEDNWFAVAALGDEGKRSKRTVAQLYREGLFNCPIDNDLRLTRIVSPVPGEDFICPEGDKLVTIEIENNGTREQSNFNLYYQVNGNAPVLEVYPGTINPGEKVVYSFDEPLDASVTVDIEVWYEIPENDYDYDDRKTAFVKFTERYEEELPYLENFDDWDSLLLTWLVENTVEERNWVTRKVTQIDDQEGYTLQFANYEFSPTQREFGAQTGTIDLIDNPDPWLFFDRSYANRDASKNDRLILEISTDCGNTFEQVAEYDREQLNTWTALPVEWEPRRARHWQTDSIQLTDFAGEEIVLRWVNVSAGGNNLFLDNIRIVRKINTGVSEFSDPDKVVLSPIPASINLNVNLTGTIRGGIDLDILSTNGRMVKSFQVDASSMSDINIDLSGLPGGVYYLRIRNDEGDQVVKRFVKI